MSNVRISFCLNANLPNVPDEKKWKNTKNLVLPKQTPREATCEASNEQASANFKPVKLLIYQLFWV